LAGLDMTTGVSTSWNPSADQRVRALAANSDTVYAGGDFANAGGMARPYLAAIDMSGAATAWAPAADGAVNAMLLADTNLYVGGAFGNVGSAARLGVAELDSSGMATPWNNNADGQVYALALSGNLYVGGNFTKIAGDSAGNFAIVAP
jgi:hypothetical protein